MKICTPTVVLLLWSAVAVTVCCVRLHQEDMSCQANANEPSCEAAFDATGTACVWCECSAIPSECLTLDQSKRVPPGVFDCKSPSTTKYDAEDSTIIRTTLEEEEPVAGE